MEETPCRKLPKRGNPLLLPGNLDTLQVFRFDKDNPVLNLNDEQWLPVVGFENFYIVSTTGKVRSLRRNKQLAENTTGTSKYMYVKLTVKMRLYNRSVHRLVAQAFVQNPGNKPMVNHIDGNKLNNNACNLEWVTCSENHHHAFATGLRSRESAKTQLGKKWGDMSKYHNVTYDAERNKWKMSLKLDGKVVVQKRFTSEQDAALYVNEMLDKFKITDRPKNIVE